MGFGDFSKRKVRGRLLPRHAKNDPVNRTTVRTIRSLSYALIVAALAVVGSFGCKEHELGGMDLQTLKRETVKENAATLTAEQQERIWAIRANTRSDFDRQVQAIIEEGKKGQAE